MREEKRHTRRKPSKEVPKARRSSHAPVESAAESDAEITEDELEQRLRQLTPLQRLLLIAAAAIDLDKRTKFHNAGLLRSRSRFR